MSEGPHTMKNVQDMSLEECVEELGLIEECSLDATLDEAARLPEHAYFTIHFYCNQYQKPGWQANVGLKKGERFTKSIVAYGYTELLCRFRLRVAVERAVRGEKP